MNPAVVMNSKAGSVRQSRNKKWNIVSLIAGAMIAGSAMAPGQAKADDASTPVKMAVKMVGLTGESGKATLNQDTATQLLANVSKMYADAGCAINFQLESFDAVAAKDKGLEYNTSSMSELDNYRKAFNDNKSMLVVDTGSWNENLHPANAWTAMPGSDAMGAIFEASVADFYQIVGHELGHYLGLDHVDDDTNMMNPIIQDYSTKITAEQCSQMRDTAQGALVSARR